MRTILQIEQHDINDNLLQIIKSLMLQNTEILIQPLVKLEEYDGDQSIESVMQALKNSGHNSAFLNDIEKGLQTSSVYSNEHQAA